MREGENGTSICFFCSCPATLSEIKVCKTCSRLFCAEHKSLLDSELCSECVSCANTSVKSEPLIDEDGVHKEGRKIILSGEAWMRSRELIANMTDIELGAKIKSYQEAVHEAELVLDYRRIMLGQAEHESAERYSKKLSRLRLIKAVDTTHHISGATLKEKSENIKGALGALGKLGLNKSQVAQLLLKLSKKPEVKP